jgi:hypothetical protein
LAVKVSFITGLLGKSSADGIIDFFFYL